MWTFFTKGSVMISRKFKDLHFCRAFHGLRRFPKGNKQTKRTSAEIKIRYSVSQTQP